MCLVTLLILREPRTCDPAVLSSLQSYVWAQYVALCLHTFWQDFMFMAYDSLWEWLNSLLSTICWALDVSCWCFRSLVATASSKSQISTPGLRSFRGMVLQGTAPKPSTRESPRSPYRHDCRGKHSQSNSEQLARPHSARGQWIIQSYHTLPPPRYGRDQTQSN